MNSMHTSVPYAPRFQMITESPQRSVISRQQFSFLEGLMHGDNDESAAYVTDNAQCRTFSAEELPPRLSWRKRQLEL